jgi:hypothetical protein
MEATLNAVWPPPQSPYTFRTVHGVCDAIRSLQVTTLCYDSKNPMSLAGVGRHYIKDTLQHRMQKLEKAVKWLELGNYKRNTE